MAAVTLAELETLKREAELDISRRLAKLEEDSGYTVDDLCARNDAVGSIESLPAERFYLRSVSITMHVPYINRWIGTSA